MATNTSIQIYIGDQSIPVFKSFTLHQEIDAHHDFELICRKDVLENMTSEFSGEFPAPAPPLRKVS